MVLDAGKLLKGDTVWEGKEEVCLKETGKCLQ